MSDLMKLWEKFKRETESYYDQFNVKTYGMNYCEKHKMHHSTEQCPECEFLKKNQNEISKR